MNPNNFPLFDVIYSETENMEESSINVASFAEKVKHLDDEGYELLYALMKCYAIKYNLDSHSPPFQAKKYKNTYKFDLNVVPPRLLTMLIHFTDKHTQKLHEELVRFKQPV